ncbi:MAG TPA: TerB N-terminal domain-containing protein [Candidatus Eisenbergiella merdipullorum]|uniref:TerB N-terminal domain-containing protein n=1 Tax=Candidatus Eisenbergiella merdipullorum TaxID=2838553 RepID=A0A9D2I8I4_9FIRM|nr:TerB N-terminal domain-containing protein [Candidatus Eisenbergiella merdipullorum]
MDLSDLTAYAEEKFHIQEQHKWNDFPGFSVLADPNTGKWVALLMRQWDSDSGTEIQRCDIKCGRRSLFEMSEPYLSLPFRMKGQKWVGVIFDNRTKPEVVFRLFDRAVYSGEQQGYTIVLDETRPGMDRTRPKYTNVYQDTALPSPGKQFSVADPAVPDKIQKMQRLYEYGDGSFAQKCKNFYRQGKFMEDYEDDEAWNGIYRRYFPTYHDLNVRQLRGYFTWRTRVRKGGFSPIATSLAYLYLYELLNGIGTDSPEDALKKMREFETGFLDSGIGDAAMRKNLRRWMLEYAVIHDVPAETARKYADPVLLEKDVSLAVLKDPEGHTDEEVFAALCTFAGKKAEQSPVLKKDAARGKHLFAAVWRTASEAFFRNGKDLFDACFGEKRVFSWRPLANAVYWEKQKHPDTDYALDKTRIYHCRGGVWQEERYDSLYFDRKRLHALLHKADREIRKYLKTGHYLRENPDEAWAAPYVEEVLADERRSEIEAARPKITINLSDLAQIRQDALLTRDSLLTEEEMDGAWEDGGKQQQEQAQTPVQPHGRPEQSSPERNPSVPLDEPYRQILLALLHGESVDARMKAHHLMPSVAADTINEALFDEIGDNVLECDGNTITVVEDYRDDILQIFGGKMDE